MASANIQDKWNGRFGNIFPGNRTNAGLYDGASEREGEREVAFTASTRCIRRVWLSYN